MDKKEFVNIALRRNSFNKKGLLHVLSSFVPLAEISHLPAEKAYTIPRTCIPFHCEDCFTVFHKLIRKFSVYDILKDDKLYIIYAI